MDIIHIPLIRHQPESYQNENWLLDPDHYREFAGRLDWDDLQAMSENPSTLWINGTSSGVGKNDRVPLEDAQRLNNSLYLLTLRGMELKVFAPGAAFRNLKRRVQGRFMHRNVEYALWVTDPMIERDYLARENGIYRIGECFATISLGEPHEGFAYKLIAAIIARESVEPSEDA